MTARLGASLMREALRRQLVNLHLELDPEPLVCYDSPSMTGPGFARGRYIAPGGSRIPQQSGMTTRCSSCRFEPREGYEQDEEWYKPIDVPRS